MSELGSSMRINLLPVFCQLNHHMRQGLKWLTRRARKSTDVIRGKTGSAVFLQSFFWFGNVELGHGYTGHIR